MPLKSCEVFSGDLLIGSAEIDHDESMAMWGGEFIPNGPCLARCSPVFRKWADAIDRKDDVAMAVIRQDMKALKLRVVDAEGTPISDVVFIADFGPEIGPCDIEAAGRGYSY